LHDILIFRVSPVCLENLIYRASKTMPHLQL